jgi:hypothetical protein
MEPLKMSEKLLDCPFCGSSDIEIFKTIESWCLCNSCKCSTDAKSSVDSAIRVWNERVDKYSMGFRDGSSYNYRILMKDIENKNNLLRESLIYVERLDGVDCDNACADYLEKVKELVG